jgi:soluble lytic murein transglycosylase-like protein
MTARLLTSERPTVRESPSYWLGPQGAALALAALVCALTAVAVSPYSNRHPPQTKTVEPLVAPMPDSNPAAIRDRMEEQHVRRLASTVSKRYRVAGDATRQFVAIAYREARRNHLDPLLVLAVIAVESRFDPQAESESGAMGLMQVIPRYHVRNGEDATRAAMLDPSRNIGLGTRVLKQYVKSGGTETAGLQRYNGTSDDATNAYANKVMAERRRLMESLRSAGDRA